MIRLHWSHGDSFWSENIWVMLTKQLLETHRNSLGCWPWVSRDLPDKWCWDWLWLVLMSYTQSDWDNSYKTRSRAPCPQVPGMLSSLENLEMEGLDVVRKVCSTAVFPPGPCAAFPSHGCVKLDCFSERSLFLVDGRGLGPCLGGGRMWWLPTFWSPGHCPLGFGVLHTLPLCCLGRRGSSKVLILPPRKCLRVSVAWGIDAAVPADSRGHREVIRENSTCLSETRGEVSCRWGVGWEGGTADPC